MPLFSRVTGRLDRDALAEPRPWAAPYLKLRKAFSGNSVQDLGTGNQIRWKRCLMTGSSVTVLGSNNVIEFGDRLRMLKARITVRGSNCRLSIGDGCSINGAFLWVTDDDSELSIGNGSVATECQIVVTDKGARLIIGDDCMIAVHSHVRCGDGHTIYDLATGEILNQAQEIIIEDRVWVTADCKVLKNVRIGSGSVIASGSVVTRDIPPNSLAAGAPAQVIRSGVSWRKENISRLPKDWFKAAAGEGNDK
jgi:acetyltransferase-like isoleucine patch superfamily enzyme